MPHCHSLLINFYIWIGCTVKDVKEQRYCTVGVVCTDAIFTCNLYLTIFESRTLTSAEANYACSSMDVLLGCFGASWMSRLLGALRVISVGRSGNHSHYMF